MAKKYTLDDIVKVSMLLLVPFIFVFDIMVFLSAHTGCIAAGCMNEFFRNSSLTIYTVNEAMRAMRR